MCTVSYVPKKDNGFILTSSRDEKSPRNARMLKETLCDNFKLIFPVDPVSGGTWIGSTELGRTCCLLNGGRKKHTRKMAYRKSRGLVLIDILSTFSLEEEIRNYDLNGIEPFTMVIIDHNNDHKIVELVWDENGKQIFYYDKSKPNIWSSVTLYSADEIKLKSELFNDFLKTNNSEEISSFHFLPENILPSGNTDQPITVSVTQIKGNQFETSIKHHDIINKIEQEEYLSILRPFYA